MPGHNDPNDTYIDVGRMRQRVALVQSSDAADSSGKPVAPTEFASRWASVEPASGVALNIAQQFTSETAYTVVMRYLEGALPSMTLNFKDRQMQILTVMHAREQNVKTTLICREYQ